MQAQLSASQKKCADSEAHCRQLQIEIERDEREQDCVRSRIEAQPMQLKELQAVRQDVRMATKVRLNKAALLEDAKKQLEAAREEYVEVVSDLERMFLKCNGQLARAKLHPACAEAANGVDYEVKVTSNVDSYLTLSVDLKVCPVPTSATPHTTPHQVNTTLHAAADGSTAHNTAAAARFARSMQEARKPHSFPTAAPEACTGYLENR